MFRAIQACVLVCSLWMPLTAQENVWRNFSGVYKPPAKATAAESPVTPGQRQSTVRLLKRGKPPWVCEPGDDWTAGLRYRSVRLSASGSTVLVEAGDSCARSGQGSNGAMWLVRFKDGVPVILAGPNQSFDGFLFSIQPTTSKGYRDVVVGSHMSASETGVSYFRFDGTSYRLIGRARVISDDRGFPKVVPE